MKKRAAKYNYKIMGQGPYRISLFTLRENRRKGFGNLLAVGHNIVFGKLDLSIQN